MSFQDLLNRPQTKPTTKRKPLTPDYSVVPRVKRRTLSGVPESVLPLALPRATRPVRTAPAEVAETQIAPQPAPTVKPEVPFPVGGAVQPPIGPVIPTGWTYQGSVEAAQIFGDTVAKWGQQHAAFMLDEAVQQEEKKFQPLSPDRQVTIEQWAPVTNAVERLEAEVKAEQAAEVAASVEATASLSSPQQQTLNRIQGLMADKQADGEALTAGERRLLEEIKSIGTLQTQAQAQERVWGRRPPFTEGLKWMAGALDTGLNVVRQLWNMNSDSDLQEQALKAQVEALRKQPQKEGLESLDEPVELLTGVPLSQSLGQKPGWIPGLIWGPWTQAQVTAEEVRRGTFTDLIRNWAGQGGLAGLSIGEAAVGWADLVPVPVPTKEGQKVAFGITGLALEQVPGGGPPGWRSWMTDELLSPQMRLRKQTQEQAEGFLESAIVTMADPFLLTQTVAEMMALVFATQKIIGQSLVKKGLPYVLGGTKIPWLYRAAPAAVASEAAASAGIQVEQTRQQTDTGLLTPGQTAINFGSGIFTGAIAMGGYRLARSVGIRDMDVMLASGSTTPIGRQNLAKVAVLSMLVEGPAEEGPQSFQEQVLQNYSLDRPLMEGVWEATAIGVVAGSVAAAGMVGYAGVRNYRRGEPIPLYFRVQNDFQRQEQIRKMKEGDANGPNRGIIALEAAVAELRAGNVAGFEEDSPERRAEIKINEQELKKQNTAVRNLENWDKWIRSDEAAQFKTISRSSHQRGAERLARRLTDQMAALGTGHFFDAETGESNWSTFTVAPENQETYDTLNVELVAAENQIFKRDPGFKAYNTLALAIRARALSVLPEAVAQPMAVKNWVEDVALRHGPVAAKFFEDTLRVGIEAYIESGQAPQPMTEPQKQLADLGGTILQLRFGADQSEQPAVVEFDALLPQVVSEGNIPEDLQAKINMVQRQLGRAPEMPPAAAPRPEEYQELVSTWKAHLAAVEKTGALPADIPARPVAGEEEVHLGAIKQALAFLEEAGLSEQDWSGSENDEKLFNLYLLERQREAMKRQTVNETRSVYVPDASGKIDEKSEREDRVVVAEAYNYDAETGLVQMSPVGIPPKVRSEQRHLVRPEVITEKQKNEFLKELEEFRASYFKAHTDLDPGHKAYPPPLRVVTMTEAVEGPAWDEKAEKAAPGAVPPVEGATPQAPPARGRRFPTLKPEVTKPVTKAEKAAWENLLKEIDTESTGHIQSLVALSTELQALNRKYAKRGEAIFTKADASRRAALPPLVKAAYDGYYEVMAGAFQSLVAQGQDAQDANANIDALRARLETPEVQAVLEGAQALITGEAAPKPAAEPEVKATPKVEAKPEVKPEPVVYRKAKAPPGTPLGGKDIFAAKAVKAKPKKKKMPPGFSKEADDQLTAELKAESDLKAKKEAAQARAAAIREKIKRAGKKPLAMAEDVEAEPDPEQYIAEILEVVRDLRASGDAAGADALLADMSAELGTEIVEPETVEAITAEIPAPPAEEPQAVAAWKVDPALQASVLKWLKIKEMEALFLGPNPDAGATWTAALEGDVEAQEYVLRELGGFLELPPGVELGEGAALARSMETRAPIEVAEQAPYERAFFMQIEATLNNLVATPGRVEAQMGSPLTLKQRLAANIKYLQVAARLRQEQRFATPPEQQVLEGWQGWDGQAYVFVGPSAFHASSKDKYVRDADARRVKNELRQVGEDKIHPQHEELKALFAEVSKSSGYLADLVSEAGIPGETLTAREIQDFTQRDLWSLAQRAANESRQPLIPEAIARGIYTLLQRLGFRRGRIFNANALGSEFLIHMPREIAAQSPVVGTLVQSNAGTVPKQISQNASFVRQEWFTAGGAREEAGALPLGFFDLVIGRSPLMEAGLSTSGDISAKGALGRPFERGGRRSFLRKSSAAFYVARALDLTADGGIVALIVPRSLLDGPPGPIRSATDAVVNRTTADDDYDGSLGIRDLFRRGEMLRELAAEGDLLAAIRLPDGVFSEHISPTFGHGVKKPGFEQQRSRGMNKRNADILILQKRATRNLAPENEAWTQIDIRAVDLQPMRPGGLKGRKGEVNVTINKYFVDHPEMVVGGWENHAALDVERWASEAGTGRLGGALVFEFPPKIIERVKKGGEVGARERENYVNEAFARIAERLPLDGSVRERPREVFQLNLPSRIPSAGVRVEDGVYEENNQFYVTKNGEPTLIPGLKESTKQRLRLLFPLRSETRATLIIMANAATDARGPANVPYADEIVDHQKVLRKHYDAFVKKFGSLWKRENIQAMGNDPDRWRLLSLEDFDPRGNDGEGASTPSAIFTENIFAETVWPEKVPDLQQALVRSVVETGEVDFRRIAKLTGQSVPSLQYSLLGRVYRNPVGRRWELEEEYLSGNVRKKLLQAQAATQWEPEYAKNVEALEAVQPKALTIDTSGTGNDGIQVNLGAHWIPSGAIKDFVDHLLLSGLPEGSAERSHARQTFQVQYAPALGLWTMLTRNHRPSKRKDAPARTLWQRASATGDDISWEGDFVPPAIGRHQWGTESMGAIELILKSLNKQIATVAVDNERGQRVTLPNETAAAREKQSAIQREFERWSGSSESGWKEQLEVAYNTNVNNQVPRAWKLLEGSPDLFEGQRAGMRLRPDQRRIVQRILQTRGHGTGLFHAVGAGKTISIVTIAVEKLRTKQAKRPMILVPKPLISSMAREFMRLYPGANLLIGTDDQMSGKTQSGVPKRVEFIDRARRGNYDAIIMTHSAFELVPMSHGGYEEFADSWLRIHTAHRAAVGTSEMTPARRIAKRILTKEKQFRDRIEKLQNRAGRKKEQASWPDSYGFEAMGVDFLIVDEADYFRNMWLPTKMGNVKGVSVQFTPKTFDFFIKTDYIQRITNDSGLVFATGTPVVKSLVEMYIWQRYLNRHGLEAQGIFTFDQWVANYSKTDIVAELDPNGTSVRNVTRLVDFPNAQEMIKHWMDIADVRMASDMADLIVEIPSPYKVDLEKLAGVTGVTDADQPGGPLVGSTVFEEASPAVVKLAKELRIDLRDPMLGRSGVAGRGEGAEAPTFMRGDQDFYEGRRKDLLDQGGYKLADLTRFKHRRDRVSWVTAPDGKAKETEDFRANDDREREWRHKTDPEGGGFFTLKEAVDNMFAQILNEAGLATGNALTFDDVSGTLRAVSGIEQAGEEYKDLVKDSEGGITVTEPGSSALGVGKIQLFPWNTKTDQPPHLTNQFLAELVIHLNEVFGREVFELTQMNDQGKWESFPFDTAASTGWQKWRGQVSMRMKRGVWNPAEMDAIEMDAILSRELYPLLAIVRELYSPGQRLRTPEPTPYDQWQSGDTVSVWGRPSGNQVEPIRILTEWLKKGAPKSVTMIEDVTGAVMFPEVYDVKKPEAETSEESILAGEGWATEGTITVQDLHDYEKTFGRGQAINIYVQPSTWQQAYMLQLADEAQQIRSGNTKVVRDPETGVESTVQLVPGGLMTVTRRGGAAALDPRLLGSEEVDGVAGEDTPYNPNGKIGVAAKNIHLIYLQTTEWKGTQLVFSDEGTPKELQPNVPDESKADQAEAIKELLLAGGTGAELPGEPARPKAKPRFSVYQALKEELVGLGIPGKEIQFAHDAKTDDARAQLDRAVNAGSVRIVIGSTAKLGVGRNVQERLVSTHHLDVPWNPRDIVQRDGRILRQGNMLFREKIDVWKEGLEEFRPKIFHYNTIGSFDAYRWQINMHKARVVALATTNQTADRVIRDTDGTSLTAAQIMASTTGKKEMFELGAVKTHVMKLQTLKADQTAELDAANRRVVELPRMIEAAQNEQANLKNLLQARQLPPLVEKAGKSQRSFAIQLAAAPITVTPVEVGSTRQTPPSSQPELRRDVESRKILDLDAFDTRQTAGEHLQSLFDQLANEKENAVTRGDLPRDPSMSAQALVDLEKARSIDPRFLKQQYFPVGEYANLELSIGIEPLTRINYQGGQRILRLLPFNRPPGYGKSAAEGSIISLLVSSDPMGAIRKLQDVVENRPQQTLTEVERQLAVDAADLVANQATIKRGGFSPKFQQALDLALTREQQLNELLMVNEEVLTSSDEQADEDSGKKRGSVEPRVVSGSNSTLRDWEFPGLPRLRTTKLQRLAQAQLKRERAASRRQQREQPPQVPGASEEAIRYQTGSELEGMTDERQAQIDQESKEIDPVTQSIASMRTQQAIDVLAPLKAERMAWVETDLARSQLNMLEHFLEWKIDASGQTLTKRALKDLTQAVEELRGRIDEAVKAGKAIEIPEVEFELADDDLPAEIQSVLASKRKQQEELDPVVRGRLARVSQIRHGAGRPVERPRAAEDMLKDNMFIRPVMVPELVEIAEALIDRVGAAGGKPKEIKIQELMTNAEMRFGDFSPHRKKGGQIRLTQEIFTKKNRILLAQTLGHELAHLTDWLPDEIQQNLISKSIPRGTLIGRLQKLTQSGLQSFVSKDGSTLTDKELEKEGKELSRMWRPWNRKQAGRGHAKYRDSGTEIYADVVSAILVNPHFAQAVAPNFFKAWFEFLDKSPLLNTVYFEIQEILAGTDQEVAKHRLARMRAGWMEGRVKSINLQYMAMAVRDKMFMNWSKALSQYWVNIDMPYRDLMTKWEAKYGKMPEDWSPINMMEETSYMGSVVHGWMAQNINPLWNRLRNAGVSNDDFGIQLFLDRIIKGDRSEMANPWGIESDLDDQGYHLELEAMRGTYQDWQLSVLDEAAAAMRTLGKGIAQDAVDAGLYNQKTYDEKIKDNLYYAPFLVINHMTSGGMQGVTHHIFKQFGTFQHIRNPADAYVLKMVVTIKAIQWNLMKLKAIEFLYRMQKPDDPDVPPTQRGVSRGDDLIKQAPMEIVLKAGGVKFPKPMEAFGPGEKMVTYYVNGLRRGVIVPNELALSLNNSTVGANQAAIEILNLMNTPLRMLFTGYNPGFMAANVVRDWARLWKNMSEERDRPQIPGPFGGTGWKWPFTRGQTVWGTMKGVITGLSASAYRAYELQKPTDEAVDSWTMKLFRVPLNIMGSSALSRLMTATPVNVKEDVEKMYRARLLARMTWLQMSRGMGDPTSEEVNDLASISGLMDLPAASGRAQQTARDWRGRPGKDAIDTSEMQKAVQTWKDVSEYGVAEKGVQAPPRAFPTLRKWVVKPFQLVAANWWWRRTGGDLFRAWRELGDFSESIAKIGSIYVKANQYGGIEHIPADERSRIRRQFGSPDFLTRGKGTHLTNQLFLYSRAIISGWHSDLQVMQFWGRKWKHAELRPSAAGWWWKTAKFNILPKILLFMAVRGQLFFGSGLMDGLVQLDEDDDKDPRWNEYLRAIMEATHFLRKALLAIPPWDQERYISLPLPMILRQELPDFLRGRDDEVVYQRLVQDDAGATIGMLTTLLLNLFSESEATTVEKLRDIARYAGGEVPTLTPVVNVGISGVQMGFGINPYDRFRGRNVLSESELHADDNRKWKKWGWWMLKQSGVDMIYPIDLSSKQYPTPVGSYDAIKKFPLAGPAFTRFLKAVPFSDPTLDDIEFNDEMDRSRERLDEIDVIAHKYKQYQGTPTAADPASPEALREQTRLGREAADELYGRGTKDYRARVESMISLMRFSASRGGSNWYVNRVAIAGTNTATAGMIDHIIRENQDYEREWLIGLLEDMRTSGIMTPGVTGEMTEEWRTSYLRRRPAPWWERRNRSRIPVATPEQLEQLRTPGR